MAQETFQYHSEVYPEREIEEKLGELGSVGWELVTAQWEEYSYGGKSSFRARCILKRRVLVDEFAETLSALKAR